MDTSETYINMSDCPEIQEQHEPTEGDLCAIKFMGYSIELIIGQTPARADKKDNRDLLRTGNTTWLPRQDQIQEMIESKSGIWIHMHNRFGKFCINQIDADHSWCLVINTPEKAWLAFYMYEKHKKIWNGNKWINKNT